MYVNLVLSPMLVVLISYHQPPALANRLTVRNRSISSYLIAGVDDYDRLGVVHCTQAKQ